MTLSTSPGKFAEARKIHFNFLRDPHLSVVPNLTDIVKIHNLGFSCKYLKLVFHF